MFDDQSVQNPTLDSGVGFQDFGNVKFNRRMPAKARHWASVGVMLFPNQQTRDSFPGQWSHSYRKINHGEAHRGFLPMNGRPVKSRRQPGMARAVPLSRRMSSAPRA